ncbi:MAG: response regulator, partial [Verrucomicrobia bacterium]|nr:response regulator [Verrucomicrobiota bacterium]
RRKDGVWRWFEATLRPFASPSGEQRAVVISRDVTERKRAEEALQRTEALYRRAIAATGAVPYHRDYEANVFTYFGDGIRELTGYSREEMTPDLWESLIQEYQFHGPLAGLSYAEAVSKVRGAQAVQWQCDCRILTRDRRTRWIADASVEILGQNGQAIGSIGLLQDITERRRAEEQFFRAQRLESIGTLASGIAHDLNNVLAPILMSSHMLRTLGLNEESQKLVATVETAARRGADIVRQVLTFARGAEGERIPLQPAHVVKDVVKLLRETLPKNLTLNALVPRNLWTVTADPTQFHQLLLNLCLNARDAMPAGGTLEIVAQNADLDDQFAAMVPAAKAGPHCLLRVRDTGVGIAPDILDKIFDPFFTTKPPGHGTGLGLSTVSGIVKAHGGFITVDSEVGVGSTFSIYLPASPAALTPVAAPSPATLARGHGEVVLVVDDEADIREVTSRMLDRHGYHVLTAADGAEALSTFIQHRDEVQLVLTDLMMPNMDGPSLVRVLRKLEPDLKIIASSGGATDLTDSQGANPLLDLAVDAFLHKPFTAEQLLQTLNASLAPQSA